MSGRRHTAFNQLALIERSGGKNNKGWRLLGGEDWDLHVDAPLRWAESEGRAQLLFAAQQRGRNHLWRLDVASGEVGLAFEGGWVQGFDAAAGVIVTASDAATHPVRLHAQRAEAGVAAAP